MRSIDIIEAAEFLGLHCNTLQARAKAGEIPGVKIGKEWRFIDVDLVEYMRSQYLSNKQDGQESCRSTSEAKSGGTRSRSKVDQGLEEALARVIGKRRSASTTRSKQNSGKPSLSVVQNAHGTTHALPG